MTKVILTALLAMGAVAANAADFCNPEQQDCPIFNVRVVEGNKMTTENSTVLCNPEQSACVVYANGHVPKWLSDLNEDGKRIVGGTPVNPFEEKGN